MVDFNYSQTADTVTLQVSCSGVSACAIDFEPAVSLRAEVESVELNGKTLPFHLNANDEDQHISTHFSASGKSNALRIHLRNDFTVTYDASLPPLGSRSEGLRILSESWTPKRDALTLQLSGLAGRTYELNVSGGSQVASADGADLSKTGTARVHFPSGSAASGQRTSVIFHLSNPKPGGKHATR